LDFVGLNNLRRIVKPKMAETSIRKNDIHIFEYSEESESVFANAKSLKT
jgi:hypothetical protein